MEKKLFKIIFFKLVFFIIFKIKKNEKTFNIIPFSMTPTHVGTKRKPSHIREYKGKLQKNLKVNCHNEINKFKIIKRERYKTGKNKGRKLEYGY